MHYNKTTAYDALVLKNVQISVIQSKWKSRPSET